MSAHDGRRWGPNGDCHPEVAGSSPVEPATKTQSYRAVISVTAFTLPKTLPSCLEGMQRSAFIIGTLGVVALRSQTHIAPQTICPPATATPTRLRTGARRKSAASARAGEVRQTLVWLRQGREAAARTVAVPPIRGV